ncbi:hypothetical protein [Moorena producens]|uniref:hypothetical protein n=1 Tax=Moorena producens TaxID=1155739 RepID=UPI003C78D613
MGFLGLVSGRVLIVWFARLSVVGALRDANAPYKSGDRTGMAERSLTGICVKSSLRSERTLTADFVWGLNGLAGSDRTAVRWSIQLSASFWGE